MEGNELKENEDQSLRLAIQERERRKQMMLETLRQRMKKKEEKGEQKPEEEISKKIEEISNPIERKTEKNTQEDEEELCRVCRSGREENRPLFYPCRCRGSIKYVHQDCLLTWISHSHVESCELCKTKYTFTPVYAPGTPYHLPINELAIGGISKLAKWGQVLLRFLTVLTAWSIFFPIITSWIFKFYFGMFADLENSSEWLEEFSLKNMVYNWGSGLALTAFVLAVSLALGSLLEYIQAHLLERQVFANREENDPQNNQENVNEEDEIEQHEEEEVEDQINEENEENVPLHVQQQNQQERVARAAGIAIPDHQQQQGMIGIFNFIVRIINGPVLPIEMDDDLAELVGMNGSIKQLLWKVGFVVKCFAGFMALIIFVPKTIGSVVFLLIERGIQVYHANSIQIASNSTEVQIPIEVSSVSFTGNTFNNGLACLVTGYFCLSLSSGIWALLSFLYSRRGKNQRSPIQQLVSLLATFSKVAIILSLETAVFPIYAGYFADYCSYDLLHKSGTFSENAKSWFVRSPIFSVLMHFVIGILYMLSFASFVSWMRETLRERILWFFRNPNDPDFDPIKEIIEQPTIRHVRKIFISVFIYGFVLGLLIWVPTKIMRNLLPSFAFISTGYVESSDEIPMDFGFVQIFLPVLLNRKTKPAIFLKKCTKLWFNKMAELLSLSSYLLQPKEGTTPEEDQVYYPPYFKLRIATLIISGFATLSLASLAIMVIPTSIGRIVLSAFPFLFINDVYKFMIGCGILWGFSSISISLWDREGERAIISIIKKYVTVSIKWVVFIINMFVVAPIILGGIFETTFISPIFSQWNESTFVVYYVNWSIGATIMKIAFEIVMFEGFNNVWKTSIERLKADGLLGLNLTEAMKNLCFPLLFYPLYFYTLPYVAVELMVYITDASMELKILSLRYGHLTLLLSAVSVIVLFYVASLFPYFYQAIYDDRYLVGMKLHNMGNEQESVEIPRNIDENQPEIRLENANLEEVPLIE